MASEIISRDGNRVTVLAGITNDSNQEVRMVRVDPVTGRILCSATGGSSVTVYTETPSGTINGSNKNFTTAHTINTIYSFGINGQFIHPVDFSVAGSTITFVTAPDASLSGTPFTIIYS